MKSFIVDKKTDLNSFLTDKYFGELSYGRLMKLYRKKDVKINGKRVSANMPLACGDMVDVYYNGTVKLAVVYEDDDIVIVDKPVGIESADYYEIVKQTYGAALFVHRLDRNTSGIIVFALNNRAYEELLKAFKERTVYKYYLACVHGFFQEKSGVLTDYLVKDAESGRVKVYKQPRAGAQKIVTGYEEIARSERASVLKVKLYTGKTHQIRAHLAFYGHFILGDGKYGDDRINRAEGVKKQLLRATEIRFRFNEGDYLYRLSGKTFSVQEGEIFSGLNCGK